MTIVLGPNLSVAQPLGTASTLRNIIKSENAPEVAAAVQPKSSRRNLKNTPKEWLPPYARTHMKKDAITMNQP